MAAELRFTFFTTPFAQVLNISIENIWGSDIMLHILARGLETVRCSNVMQADGASVMGEHLSLGPRWRGD